MTRKHHHSQVPQPAQVIYPPFWDRETAVLLAVAIGGLALIAYLSMAVVIPNASHWKGTPRVRIVHAQVQYTVLAGDGSDIGERLHDGSCYIDFGEQGGLILKDEWQDKFTAGRYYHVWAKNHSGAAVDKIITWEDCTDK